MPGIVRWFGRPQAALVALLVIAVWASPAAAETIAFTAGLSGTAQVPSNPSKGRGTITVTLDTQTKVLTWSGDYTGATGQPIAAHFHGPADATMNGPVAVDVNAFSSPFQGTATLTEAQVTNLLAGRWYFNIHTPSYPGGELRGNLGRAR